MKRVEAAKASRDPLAALELLDAMENWSEDRLCAGWHIGLAKMVDSAIAGGYGVGDDWGQIDEETLAIFRRCREASGGTWIFDGDTPSWRRFVADAEWLAMGRKEEHE